MDFLCELKRKVRKVREWYRKSIKGFLRAETRDLNADEEKLFQSATRWHHNSHLSEEDWIRMFHSIANEMDVKEVMQIDTEIVTFINMKKSKEVHKEKLSLPDLLDCLEPELRKLYKEKLDDKQDEFDCKFAMDPQDQLFFLHFFTPVAMLKTYLKAHPSLSVSDALPELFTLGSGSETEDLSEEITVFCDLCIDSDDFNIVCEENISAINKVVFIKQVEDRFRYPGLFLHKPLSESFDSEAESVQSEEHSFGNFNPLEINDGVSSDNAEDIKDDSFEIFNPLVNVNAEADNDECFEIFNPLAIEDEKDKEQKLKEEMVHSNICKVCNKRFSKDSFLKLHWKLFHSSRMEGDQKLKLQYIDKGEELLESFLVHEKRAKKGAKKLFK